MSARLVLVLGDLFIPDRAIDIPAKFKKLLTPGKIGQVLCLGNLTSASVYNFLRSLAPDLQIVKGDFDIPLHAPTTSSTPSGYVAGDAGGGSGGGYTVPTALSKVVTHGGLRIGLTHGHTIIPPGDPDSLLIAARQMDVDVLCWGGTSRFEAYEMEGKFFVNPGSATGAVPFGVDGSLGGSFGSTAKKAGENGNATAGSSGFEVDADGELKVTPSFVLMDVQGDVLVLYVYQLRTDQDGNESVAVEKVSYRKGGNQ